VRVDAVDESDFIDNRLFVEVRASAQPHMQLSLLCVYSYNSKSVRLSCLSVTLWYNVDRTIFNRIKSLLTDSPETLVFQEVSYRTSNVFPLGRLVSETTHYVSIGTLNPTHSLP